MEVLYKYMKHALSSIRRELLHHGFDYLILFISGCFFLAFLQSSQGDRFLGFVGILMFASSYIIWGLYHHGTQKTLHIKNLVEYILIGFTIIFLVVLALQI